MATLFALLLAAGAVVALNVIKGLSWSTSFFTVLAGVVPVAVLIAVPVRRLFGSARGTLPLADTTLARAREDLAQALVSGWAKEERLRRINDPWPLPVRWSGEHAGTFDEIGQIFTGLQSRRLVILGPAGAGKTVLAVKLVRELLRARQPGDPVPVLLSAATWTDTCTMNEWLAGQLALDHPGLAVRVRTGTGDAIPLAWSLAASEVLPVIDGLDELPEGRRAEVIAEVNAYGSDHPVVLTSRLDEYDAATVARSVTLASVIRLDPLETTDVPAYLEAATEAPHERWRPVFDALDTKPGGALAEALTNPLMLWLARTVYENGNTEPGELADGGRFGGREVIEGHLLAGFVPAAYTPPGRTRGFRCSAAQAQRWLGFLAAWQSRSGAQDIAWWRMCLAEPGWSVVVFTLRTVLYTCVAWWAITWALGRRGYWRAGAYTGQGHYRDLVLAGPLGRAMRPLTAPLVEGFSPGFDREFDSFLRSVAAFGLAATAGVAVGAGLVLGFGTAFQAPAPRTPRLTLATFRLAVLWPWLAITLLACVVWAAQGHREPVTVIASLWRTQLMLIWIGVLTVGWLLSSLAVPVDVSSAAGPTDLLRGTRRVYLLRAVAGLAWVATVWLWAGAAFADAAAAATVAGFVGAAVLGRSDRGAWPRYREAQFRLSVRRRLPWRFLPFLADAHRRGVLRQVGAAYQFRHIRLQEQLAAGYSPLPPRLTPWVAYAHDSAADAWSVVRKRLAEWRADPHIVAVDANTVSGVIAPRSPMDSVRQQIVSYPSLALTAAGVAVALLLSLIRWYYCLAGLFFVVIALAVRAQARLRRRKAESGVVPRSWALRINADAIYVSQDNTTIRVAMADIQRVEAGLVRSPDGSATDWFALHARLHHALAVPFPVCARRLPLVWLATTRTGNRTLPQLQATIRWFPDALVGQGLARVKRAAATEYSASGIVMEPRIVPAAGGALGAAAISLVLLLVGQSAWSFLFLPVCLLMVWVCWYRLSQRAAMRTLPAGPWSLRVTPHLVDVEANGVVTHLAPDDIERADLRIVPGGWGKVFTFQTVQLRLRPGVSAPYLTRDGWFSVYPKLVGALSEVPTELVAALHRFAGHRSGPKLARTAKTRGVVRA